MSPSRVVETPLRGYAVTLQDTAEYAPAVGAPYAQPRAPAFGKPGEPINLVVGFQPY